MQNLQNLSLKVGGVHCQNCASKVTAVLKGIKGVKNIEVEIIKNEGYGNVKIDFTSPANVEMIKEEIQDFGYEILE